MDADRHDTDRRHWSAVSGPTNDKTVKLGTLEIMFSSFRAAKLSTRVTSNLRLFQWLNLKKVFSLKQQFGASVYEVMTADVSCPVLSWAVFCRWCSHWGCMLNLCISTDDMFTFGPRIITSILCHYPQTAGCLNLLLCSEYCLWQWGRPGGHPWQPIIALFWACLCVNLTPLGSAELVTCACPGEVCQCCSNLLIPTQRIIQNKKYPKLQHKTKRLSIHHP